MITNRRQFLVKCSTTALLTGVEGAWAFPRSLGEPREDRGHPSLATFLPHVSSSFRVQCGPAAGVVLSLAKAEEHPGLRRAQPSEGPPRCEAFILLFFGAKESPLAQETYVLDHAVLGRLSIFLVPTPIESDASLGYQAVFNRLVGEEPTQALTSNQWDSESCRNRL